MGDRGTVGGAGLQPCARGARTEPREFNGMKTRDTLLGLVVLGLVLGGVFWARGRDQSGDAVPVPGSAASAHRVPDATVESAVPDVTLADGAVDSGEVRVILSVTPRPPVAFEKNLFRVRVESRGEPAVLDDGRISFEMKMPMGDHRYTLVPGQGGWLEAEVVLPFCRSGNPRWYATVQGSVAGRPVTARFRLDLTKPGSAPTPPPNA